MARLRHPRTMWTLFIFGLTLAAQGEGVERHAEEGIKRKFPDNFQFGAATAAYQVEGAWNVSDKGESIWDRAMHACGGGVVVDGSSGDVADDSYHQFRRDVEMLRELGVHFYRFSMAWSRLLPSGHAERVSPDGVRYYSELLAELRRYNITPLVTLYHWDLPQSLQDLGGWANPLIVDWFEDYARVVFELFADRVSLWVTINEPMTMCAFGYSSYGFGSAVPRSQGIGDLLCTKNALLAHARAWRLYDKEYRPRYGGEIGPCNQIIWFEPASPSEEDIQLAEEATQLFTGLYTHAIFSTEGGWPPLVEERLAARSAAQGYPRSRLPPLSPDEIRLIRGTYDFFGLNTYTSKKVRRSNSTSWPLAAEMQLDLYADPSWEKTDSAWFHVNPPGIRKILRYLKERYNNPRVMITENGYSSGAGLEDHRRVSYFRNYLEQVLDAILLDGVNVTHYTAWSLMDNFEWNHGYTARFGLYEVHYSDPARTRRPRLSALAYRQIVRERTIDHAYRPSSLDISASPAPAVRQLL